MEAADFLGVIAVWLASGRVRSRLAIYSLYPLWS